MSWFRSFFRSAASNRVPSVASDRRDIALGSRGAVLFSDIRGAAQDATARASVRDAAWLTRLKERCIAARRRAREEQRHANLRGNLDALLAARAAAIKVQARPDRIVPRILAPFLGMSTHSVRLLAAKTPGGKEVIAETSREFWARRFRWALQICGGDGGLPSFQQVSQASGLSRDSEVMRFCRPLYEEEVERRRSRRRARRL